MREWRHRGKLLRSNKADEWQNQDTHRDGLVLGFAPQIPNYNACFFFSFQNLIWFIWFLNLFLFLLRYHSHNINFAILKYTVQWFLIYPLSCATITAIYYLITEHFITPQRISRPIYRPVPIPRHRIEIWCLYGFTYSGHFIWMEAYSMASFP